MQDTTISDTVLQYWRNKTRIKKTNSGWYTGNAPCCIHNGETIDRRRRGGIILDLDGGFTFNCFNCKFKTKFVLGKVISPRTRDFMAWLGMDNTVIQKLNLDSLRYAKAPDIVVSKQSLIAKLRLRNFTEYKMVNGARPLTDTDTKYVDYLNGRGLDIKDYDFYITPDAKGRNNNRIIIPYKHKNKIVGWTSRYLDDKKPKFLNEHQQHGFVFGTNLQNRIWNYAIVCEGILDAVSIKGLAVLHNDITTDQMALLNRLGKQIIVVIDQDRSGIHLAELAIKAGFGVSIPNWGLKDDGKPIHDINEAVQKYGRTTTLLSIIQAHETSKIKIHVALNNMRKRMHIDDRVHV